MVGLGTVSHWGLPRRLRVALLSLCASYPIMIMLNRALNRTSITYGRMSRISSVMVYLYLSRSAKVQKNKGRSWKEWRIGGEKGGLTVSRWSVPFSGSEGSCRCEGLPSNHKPVTSEGFTWNRNEANSTKLYTHDQFTERRNAATRPAMYIRVADRDEKILISG